MPPCWCRSRYEAEQLVRTCICINTYDLFFLETTHNNHESLPQSLLHPRASRSHPPPPRHADPPHLRPAGLPAMEGAHRSLSIHPAGSFLPACACYSIVRIGPKPPLGRALPPFFPAFFFFFFCWTELCFDLGRPLLSSLDLAKSEKKASAYFRKEASWRRMLVQQPPALSLGYFQLIDSMGPLTYCKWEIPAPKGDGLRMNVLYDLILFPLGNPWFVRTTRVYWRRWVPDFVFHRMKFTDETKMPDVVIFDRTVMQCTCGPERHWLGGRRLEPARGTKAIAYPLEDWTLCPDGEELEPQEQGSYRR